jgi:1-pyrroline-5-carboxylate dehydrogenase
MTIADFHNEPYLDFLLPANRQAMREALVRVRSQLGREYDLWINGAPAKGGAVFESRNPSRPAEVIGLHQGATAAQAAEAVESANEFFPTWGSVPAGDRCQMLLRVAEILRQRKLEFDAWLVLEAGKTWPEAEADVSEAIDFCGYYARQMMKLAGSHPMLHMPGEHDELVYLPLGAGAVIAPWNFPLAILAGMTVASLVAGNIALIKPSSDTPTIAAKFAEVLVEAGFPGKSFCLLTGGGREVGEALVGHPRTRFVCFTGSRDVGLRINELAAKAQPGQRWIKRAMLEMGGKDAIIVDDEADLRQAVAGVVASAFGFQGQKCSACSRAIVHQAVYEEFLERLVSKVNALAVGPAEDPGNYMGPVINERAFNAIQEYIDIGRGEARLVAGGGPSIHGGYFLRPAVFADVAPSARIFREEIFGPVLAVSKALNFEHALDLANESEYGLTGAVYTANPRKIALARERFFVGNLYFNRKCTGAMVGAHPFGGFNMSGTDSKAGGPDYLLQFLQAKSIASVIF